MGQCGKRIFSKIQALGRGAFGKHNIVVFKNYMEVADLRHLFIDINSWQIR